LDNTLILYLYIPKQVPPQALYEAFGVDQFTLLESGATRLPVLNTELNNNLRSLITILEKKNNIKQMRVDIIKEGDANEIQFLVQLIEDRNRSITSYYEFMVQLQRSVASKSNK